MVGDSDNIQVAAPGNIIEYLLYRCQAIAGAGVHVNVGATRQLSMMQNEIPL
jgi:hypothetical protein